MILVVCWRSACGGSKDLLLEPSMTPNVVFLQAVVLPGGKAHMEVIYIELHGLKFDIKSPTTLGLSAR